MAPGPTRWWGLAGSNRRPPACELKYIDIIYYFMLHTVFSNPANNEFKHYFSTVSVCSDPVYGQQCGQKYLPNNSKPDEWKILLYKLNIVKIFLFHNVKEATILLNLSLKICIAIDKEKPITHSNCRGSKNHIFS